MIVIVDYDSGNLGSIKNMFKRQGIEARISGDSGEIADAERLILPGVGSFDHGMRNLERLGLREVLDQKVKVERVPILFDDPTATYADGASPEPGDLESLHHRGHDLCFIANSVRSESVTEIVS